MIQPLSFLLLADIENFVKYRKELRFFKAVRSSTEKAFSVNVGHFQMLQKGNRRFFGQLKTRAKAYSFVENSVENVKNAGFQGSFCPNSSKFSTLVLFLTLFFV
ncbi:hypothetical protein [Ruminococcus sp. FC2018]|uniref:hypothetical protein n=1 Tax=Ruminococcus sp. FC2018 TaxID=1410617 RepID=UPI000490A7A8|nr:hypothetical protein [Ruminococcus sp. FC2018]